MHNCTCITDWHDILSLPQYISPAIELKKLMGHGSTPSDPWPMWPIRFSWPIWPMTHRPIPCSVVDIQSPTAEIRWGKKIERKKDKNHTAKIKTWYNVKHGITSQITRLKLSFVTFMTTIASYLTTVIAKTHTTNDITWIQIGPFFLQAVLDTSNTLLGEEHLLANNCVQCIY